MKSLFAITVLCVAICGCGGSGNMYRVPKAQRSFTVSQYSSTSPAPIQTSSTTCRQYDTQEIKAPKTSFAQRYRNKENLRRYDKARADASREKLRMLPAALASKVKSKIKSSNLSLPKISISKENISTLDKIKTKLSNFQLSDLKFAKKEEDVE